jgi:hypothetical protein
LAFEFLAALVVCLGTPVLGLVLRAHPALTAIIALLLAVVVGSALYVPMWRRTHGAGATVRLRLALFVAALMVLAVGLGFAIWFILWFVYCGCAGWS